jgi:hypothetical protein
MSFSDAGLRGGALVMFTPDYRRWMQRLLYLVVVGVVLGLIFGLAKRDHEQEEPRPQASTSALAAAREPDRPAQDLASADPALVERLRVAAALRPLLGAANADARVQPTGDGDELVITTPPGDCDRRALVNFRKALAALELDPADYGFVRMRCEPDGAAVGLR